MISQTIYINQLIDTYGSILTKKQFEYLELYYREDLSLSEIAEILHVSRNAVHDNLKRTVELLNQLEKQLNLLKINLTIEKLKHVESLAEAKALIHMLEIDKEAI